MQQIYRPGHPDRQRGAVAIELAIVAIAGFIVAVMGTMAMLGSSFFVTANGEIDVDGNDTILLSGIDELAVAKLKFMVEVTTDALFDLTPPNTVDDKQTDHDSSGRRSRSGCTSMTGQACCMTSVPAHRTASFTRRLNCFSNAAFS